MRQFTDKEIELCRKIAKKERKIIRHGDYYWFTELTSINRLRLMNIASAKIEGAKEMLPIWQEHDCIEFLIRKGYGKILNFINYEKKGQWTFTAENFILETPYNKTRGEGETPLEALLSAVLAMMEERWLRNM